MKKKNIYIWLKPEFLGVRWILWKRTLSISNRFRCVNYVISIPNSDINTESTNVISLIKEGKKNHDLSPCSINQYHFKSYK